jgi:hypothetical protein
MTELHADSKTTASLYAVVTVMSCLLLQPFALAIVGAKVQCNHRLLQCYAVHTYNY